MPRWAILLLWMLWIGLAVVTWREGKALEAAGMIGLALAWEAVHWFDRKRRQ